MGKKLIGIAVAAIMLLGVFGLTGCDNVSLADYKVTGKAKIDAHFATKTQNDYCPGKWAEVCNAVVEGKQAVEDATNKSEVDTAVTNAKTTINEIATEEVTVDGISNQFDLTELKEYWTGSIDDDFEDDRVVVIMKKTTTYPELELETFGLDNAESLHYSFLAPTNENPNFHQMLVIYLKTKGKDQVVLAINELNKLDFIKTASPEYIYGTQDD